MVTWDRTITHLFKMTVLDHLQGLCGVCCLFFNEKWPEHTGDANFLDHFPQEISLSLQLQFWKCYANFHFSKFLNLICLWFFAAVHFKLPLLLLLIVFYYIYFCAHCFENANLIKWSIKAVMQSPVVNVLPSLLEQCISTTKQRPGAPKEEKTEKMSPTHFIDTFSWKRTTCILLLNKDCLVVVVVGF